MNDKKGLIWKGKNRFNFIKSYPIHSSPYAAFGNFTTVVNQTLLTGHTLFIPIFLKEEISNDVSIGKDRFTITIHKGGLYKINYGIIPQSGADLEAEIAVLIGSPENAKAISASIMPLIANSSEISTDFLAVIPAETTLFLGVHSINDVVLTENNLKTAINAYITIIQMENL